MNYSIAPNELRKFCKAACEKYGYTPENADITAKVLTETDMMGTHSHGTKNLCNYLRKGEAGGIKVNADTNILKEGPAWALMDGGAGIGMVTAYRAMEKTIEKAANCGIAIGIVNNSTHYGAAGYYACMAAKRGMVGISMSNTDTNMCIPGGKGREIGNSPLAIAIPQKSGDPLFLDIALSAVAALKIVKANNEGKSIPDTWVVDKDGHPSTNPASLFDGGAAQPMAGHKGYGLAMIIEILTGVMSGGAILHEIPSWLDDLSSANKVSHCFIAIDISKFMEIDHFENRLEEYTDAIHNTPKRDDSAGIFVPGEIENNRYAKSLTDGIQLPDDVSDSLIKLSEMSGIEIKLEKRS